LDYVEGLAATTILVGHRDPSAPDDDAARILDETRRYIVDFDQLAAASDSAAHLIAAMMDRHGDLGNPYTLWVAASDQFSTPQPALAEGAA
jgi:hypothetical protein